MATARGVRAGFQGAYGVFVGDTILLLCTALGAAGVLRTYPAMFMVVKYVGAAYLAWVGFNLLRAALAGLRARPEALTAVVTASGTAADAAGSDAALGATHLQRPFRRALLDRLGLPFEVAAPDGSGPSEPSSAAPLPRRRTVYAFRAAAQPRVLRPAAVSARRGRTVRARTRRRVEANGARAATRLAAAGRRALSRDDLPVAADLLGRAIDRLVGVTTQCDYPAEVTEITEIGDFASPNLEAVAAVDVARSGDRAAGTASPRSRRRPESPPGSDFREAPQGNRGSIRFPLEST